MSTNDATRRTRLEHDCIGTMEVPDDVYWGIHTQRAIGNFTVSGIPDSAHPQLVKAYATVKRACAEANEELGLIDRDKARAIIAACLEIEAGGLADQFPVDVLQGGAGTSTNMNMNEVIANRALEIAGHARGDYAYIHPNDDVNHSQSTNDTYPAACKLALIDALGPLAEETKKLARAFHDLADRHANDVTIGRTQLQDAVPMTYGQEFHAFASFMKADTGELERVVPQLMSLNLGATAIGTGICADLRFRKAATEHLARITGLPITAAPDPIAAMTDMSAYIAVSQTVKNLAIHLKKAADDLRLLNSGPHDGFNDLNVPARQAGSSIMPGKVNPVIPECVDQCCFMVFGMDTTVTWAASEGQLQLNAFDPVMIHALLGGIDLLTRAMAMFRERCVDGITINAAVGRRYAEYSPSIAATLNDAIGYEHAADIAKEAAVSGRSVREVAGERTDLPAEQLDALLDPIALSRRLGQTCREHHE
ncbi:aspartate ammonia-lyase [Bifidobacterium ramosum]|uniref:Aspartate ammonia-lyase n=1 Tax=Bifidobacterium ramosum TaxID=1798158 RepID=A0A6L4X353_9BIFI|nr:aspartate ammonia-lyase [Bifidobacterium ramosum]KAB8289198.1 aspartate ammonia-lyase [Bifidobacterium ramosum]NEG70907.1 aspartate ammonia-lyase [Bifidobacterium ramosum]